MIKNIEDVGKLEVIKIEEKWNKDLEVIKKLKSLKKNNDKYRIIIV